MQRVKDKVVERVKDKVVERVKDKVVERVKDKVVDRVTNKVIDRVTDKAVSTLFASHTNIDRDQRQTQSIVSVSIQISPHQTTLINDMLNNPKYAAIVMLNRWMKSNHHEVNIYSLILEKALDEFINKYVGKIGDSLISRVRACLQALYEDIDARQHQTNAPVVTLPPQQLPSKASTQVAQKKTVKLTIDALREASTDAQKLQLLDTDDGWRMGCDFIHAKDWKLVDEYITILRTLPKDRIESELHKTQHKGKSFVELLKNQSVVPAYVICNLLDGFSIQAESIRKIARQPKMKEKVIQCIADKIEIQARIELWEQCINIATPLGKFFQTTRRTLQLFSKFSDEYNEGTTLLIEIKRQLAIDQKNNPMHSNLELLLEPAPSTRSNAIGVAVVSVPVFQETIDSDTQSSSNQSVHFFSQNQSNVAEPTPEKLSQNYLIYLILTVMCASMAFRIYSMCFSEDNSNKDTLNEPNRFTM